MNTSSPPDNRSVIKPQVYGYKGKYYRRLSDVQYKNPRTRQWERVVLYQDASGVQYTRNVAEFEERFEEVQSPELEKARLLLNIFDPTL